MEKVLKHWLPREVMDSPPLEEFKPAGHGPGCSGLAGSLQIRQSLASVILEGS